MAVLISYMYAYVSLGMDIDIIRQVSEEGLECESGHQSNYFTSLQLCLSCV